MNEEKAVTTVPEGEAKKPKALTLKRGPRGTQFETVEEALAYATACYRSGMLPDHISRAEQAYFIMDKGAELGLGPHASWQHVYPSKSGKLTITTRGALAVVQACPHYESYDERIELEGTDQMKGVAIAKRKGQPATTKSFSMTDAANADLLRRKKNRRGEEYDGPWQAYVKDMLLARARDRALNIAFAAELAGVELESISDDADRLVAKAQGEGVQSVPAPRDPDPIEEPKALPAAAPPDPLLLHTLKQAGEGVAVAAEPPAAPAEAQAEEISKGVDEALGEGSEPDTADAAVASPTATECQGCGTLYHADRDGCPECGLAKGEAPPPPPKKKKRRPGKGHKVGDILHGTRRVCEVDEDGRPTVVEKLTAEEKKAHKEGSLEPQKPGVCPRGECGEPLNLLGQCDACGWPTDDQR